MIKPEINGNFNVIIKSTLKAMLYKMEQVKKNN